MTTAADQQRTEWSMKCTHTHTHTELKLDLLEREHEQIKNNYSVFSGASVACVRVRFKLTVQKCSDSYEHSLMGLPHNILHFYSIRKIQRELKQQQKKLIAMRKQLDSKWILIQNSAAREKKRTTF